MQLQRNYLVYCIKYMAMTMIIVLGSILTAQALHAEENTGDRCAVLCACVQDRTAAGSKGSPSTAVTFWRFLG